MITSIKKIKSVGSYREFERDQKISRNQFIFGFNGTGKSTLSDIFYSLSNNSEIPEIRKTLDLDDGTKYGPIEVTFGTDLGDVSYDEIQKKWSNNINLYTFNDDYIKDNVLIEKEGDIAELAVGAGSVKLKKSLSRDKEQLVKELETINDFIKRYKDISVSLGIGKNKISNANKRRLEKIQSIIPIPLDEINIRKNEISDLLNSSKELKDIDEILENLSNIDFSKDKIKINGITLLLKKTPSVTSSEIINHMEHNMCKHNLEWMIEGFKNQQDISKCPYCGQVINDDNSAKLIKKISRFINTKSNEKSKEIKTECKEWYVLFNPNTTIISIETYFNVLKTPTFLSLKKHIRDRFFIDENLFENYVDLINSISVKIWEKSCNPYTKILLLEEEKNLLINIKKLHEKGKKLIKELYKQREIIKNKILDENSIKYENALLEASENIGLREDLINVINSSKQIPQLNAKINENTIKLKDLYNSNELNKINSILEEMNIKFKIEVSKNKYYIKLKDFVSVEFDMDKKTLCSEGEERIIALAYFINQLNNDTSKKTIVIDDPITSLDLSREAVVSYKIYELMNNLNNQVLLLTHDISLIERIRELYRDSDISYLELKNDDIHFSPLNPDDYLINEENLYTSFITSVNNESEIIDAILAFMSLRPLAHIKGMKENEYQNLMWSTTYFSHSLYSQSKSILFKDEDYNSEGLYRLLEKNESILPVTQLKEYVTNNNFIFNGFDYESITEYYNLLPNDSVSSKELRVYFLDTIQRLIDVGNVDLYGYLKQIDDIYYFYDKEDGEL